MLLQHIDSRAQVLTPHQLSYDYINEQKDRVKSLEQGSESSPKFMPLAYAAGFTGQMTLAVIPILFPWLQRFSCFVLFLLAAYFNSTLSQKLILTIFITSSLIDHRKQARIQPTATMSRSVSEPVPLCIELLTPHLAVPQAATRRSPPARLTLSPPKSRRTHHTIKVQEVLQAQIEALTRAGSSL
jgi:hypothetical protein